MFTVNKDYKRLVEAYARIGDQTFDTARDLAEQIKNLLPSASFVSFLYNPRDGGIFKYVVNINVNYDRLRERDRKKLLDYQPQNEAEEQAKAELLDSMNQRREKGVADSYTHKDTYEFLGKGIKIHKGTGVIHINGLVISREVIEPGPEKAPSKSRNEVTAAKKKIRKILDFESDKLREFRLSPESIGGLKLKGQLIEFHE